jgi:DNA-binding GntR family transcriptional regulator
MLKAARAGNAVQFFQADLDFHRSLWEASGNATLREILERIVPKLFAFSTIKHSRPTKEKLASIATQHAGIIGHIRARDMKAVRREMAASMERAWQDDVELP